MIKINVDQGLCLGCGSCEACAPEVFELDTKDFKAKVKKGNERLAEASLELSPEQIEKVKEAEGNCPDKAIKME